MNGRMVVPAASVFWGSTERGLTYTKSVDGFWAAGGTGEWSRPRRPTTARSSKGSPVSELISDLCRRRRPLCSKLSTRCSRRRHASHSLAGTSEAYERGIQQMRKYSRRERSARAAGRWMSGRLPRRRALHAHGERLGAVIGSRSRPTAKARKAQTFRYSVL